MDIQTGYFLYSMPQPEDAPGKHDEFMRNIYKTKELLECTDIGATTYIRYRVELKKTAAGPKDRKHFPPIAYHFVALTLAPLLVVRRYNNECYISYRFTEYHGFVMNSALQKCGIEEVLPENLPRKNLRGKFHLEVLFVDAARIADDELLEKYAMNINARFGDFSDTSCLKEKVKKAEKWLEMARKKKGKQLEKIKEVSKIPINENLTDDDSDEPEDTLCSKRISRFPEEGKCDHLIVEEWDVFLSDDMCPENWYIAYAHFISEIVKQRLTPYLIRASHLMYEFITTDPVTGESQRLKTKLRPHYQNGEEMILDTLKKHEKTLTTKCTVLIYSIDIPAFAHPKRAQSLLDFVRKCYQLDESVPVNLQTVVNECSELFEKKCDCEKLHLSSYGSLEMVLHKKLNNAVLHSWRLNLSELMASLYHFSSMHLADLYTHIVNRICHSSVSGHFKTGTNILCEMILGGEKVHSSKIMHHSEVGQDGLKKEMFTQKQLRNIELHEEIYVSVYVVDILDFVTNEQAHQFLYNMRVENNTKDLFGLKLSAEWVVPVERNTNTSMETDSDLEIEETYKKLEVHNKKVSGMYITVEETILASRTLNNSYFKKESELERKVFTEPVKLEDGYKILSSKTPLNTSKGRITAFFIKLDTQFHSDVPDKHSFVADVLLNIVKNDAISQWMGRNMKITLKWYHGGLPNFYFLKNEDLMNSNNLAKELLKRGMDSDNQIGTLKVSVV